jgi:nicotinate-nucleotide adenylyltransferase
VTSAPTIGLFGGSFDPPHLGHLALARQARDQLALDEVRWLPAGQPWQKAGRVLAAAVDRVAMVALAIAGERGMVLDDRETRRAGPSYTIDTVDELRTERPGAALVLVVGQDQYAGLPTWHRWRDLVDAVTLAVAGRAGEPPRAAPELAARTHRVVVLDLPPLPISSTAVRAAAAAGGDVQALVGPAVAGYIARHGLYRGTPPPA